MLAVIRPGALSAGVLFPANRSLTAKEIPCHDVLLMLVKTFRGRVVRKMRKLPDGRILLKFLTAHAGEAAEEQIVTPEQWQAHGAETYDDRVTVDDLRQAANRVA
jgi:hypothetical protein